MSLAYREALKLRRTPSYLLEINYHGAKWRFSEGTLASGRPVVLETTSDPLVFEPGLIEVSGLSYEVMNITIDNSKRSNGLRFSDIEKLFSLEGAIATIYRYLNDSNLTYEDLIDGDAIIAKGELHKANHNATSWIGQIIPLGLAKMPAQMPLKYITIDAFPFAAPAALGKIRSIVLGNHVKSTTTGIPLIYVNNSTFTFLMGDGDLDVTDGEYESGVLRVCDENGAIIGPTLYTVSNRSDSLGGRYTYVDFATTPTSASLFASARGIKREDRLVQSPSQIIKYYLELAGFISSEFDLGRLVFQGWSLAGLINEVADGWEILQRICMKPDDLPWGPIAICPSWKGKVTAFPIDIYHNNSIAELHENIEIFDMKEITKTDETWFGNDWFFRYAPDYGRGGFISSMAVNKTNSAICAASRAHYGRSIQKRLDCYIIHEDSTLTAWANWIIRMFGFRHDLIKIKLPIEWSILEPGQCVNITHSWGPSRNGLGWISEPFLILPWPEIGLYDTWLTLMRISAP